MATPEDDARRELERLREIDRRNKEKQGVLQAEQEPDPFALAPSQREAELSFKGRAGRELGPLERLRKIEYLEEQQGALQQGEPLREPAEEYPDTSKGVLSDIATTGKVALTTPVAGALHRGESELQMRNMTRDLVAEQLAEDEIAAIEARAGKPIEEMKWQEFDRAAGKEYGVGEWSDRLRTMMGFREGDMHEPSGAPAFPKAPELIGGSLESGTVGLYENLVRPWFSDDGPRLSEEMTMAVQELAKDYQPETAESLEKSFLAEDATWNPTTWFDETTKDPVHDFSAFLHTVGQQAGNLGAMIIASRLGGKYGAKSFTKSVVDQRTAPALVKKAQRTGAIAGGTAAGGKTEAVLIRDGVYSEVHQRVMDEVPEEVWDGNKDYQRLTDGGLTGEEARQILAMEHANAAGNTAMVLSGVLMGTPMGAFYGATVGRTAGRTAAKEGILRRFGKGAALETGQEMAQEFTEQVTGNVSVRRVDPSQDLFEGAGEAVAQAFFVSAGPGGLGAIQSERGEGLTKEHEALLRKSQPWVNAMNDRWKYQNKVGPDTNFSKDASPQDQLKAMIELERLQKKEAEEFGKVEDEARRLMEKTGETSESILRFDAMAAGYESLRADIAKQQKRRANARKQLREEQRIAKERDDVRQTMERNVQTISQNLRLVENMLNVQNNELLEENEYEELAKLGYGKFAGANNERFILTQKGQRAIPELQREAGNIDDAIRGQYTGPERRLDRDRRQRLEEMSPDEVERELYQDSRTGLRNARAWDEEKHQANAVAVIDADSLKWVNDTMSHSAGNEFLQRIADEINDLGQGFRAYRTGGDEFVLTGPDEEALEAMMRKVQNRLDNAPRVIEGNQSVKPTVSFGIGPNEDEADTLLQQQKEMKERTGQRARRGEPPPNLQIVGDSRSPQMTLFAGPKKPQEGWWDDLFNDSNLSSSTNPYTEEDWGEYVKLADLRKHAKRLGVTAAEKEHIEMIFEVVDNLLPQSNRNNPRVTIINTVDDLKIVSPEQYNELLDLGFGMYGVRGMYSITDYPDRGVFLIASNIVSQARSTLKPGESLRSWRSSQFLTREGHQVEIMSQSGVVERGVITNIELVTPAINKKLQNKIRNKRAQVNNIDKRLTRIIGELAKLPKTSPGDPAHPTNRKRVQLRERYRQINQKFSVESKALRDMEKEAMRERTEAARANREFDRVTVQLDDGRELTFAPDENALVTEEGSLNHERWLGRIRAPAQKTWSTFWHSNLGNYEAAKGEPLTREHIQELAADTLMHETVGHYGIRGLTKDWKEYERLTHAIVDSFPDRVEELRKLGYQYRTEFSPSQNKALLGEEVMAWLAGEELGTMKPMTKKQRNVVRRFLSWLKEMLIRRGYGDYLRLNEGDLWNLIERSHDFIRNGTHPWSWTGEDGKMYMPMMRDSEIFRQPLYETILRGTRPLTEEEIISEEDRQPPPKVPTIAQAYKQVTGKRKPFGWKPITPADFKDEAKRLEREMTEGKSKKEIQQMRKNKEIPTPKTLYDEATAKLTEDEKALFGKVQSVITQAKQAIERHEKGLRSKEARISELKRLWGDEIIEQGVVPIFPEQDTVQHMLEAVTEAVKRGVATKAEVEASGIHAKLWPSKLDNLMIAYGGFNNEHAAEATGISEERIEELRQPAAQMTQEEAQVIVDWLKRDVVDKVALPRHYLNVKSMTQNNALEFHHLEEFYKRNLTDESRLMEEILGETHPLAKEYREAMKTWDNTNLDMDERTKAFNRATEILSEDVGVTNTPISREFVADQISEPAYNIWVSAPIPNKGKWEDHYERIVGGPPAEGVSFSDLEHEMQRRILKEQERDMNEGPFIGYDPVLERWIDFKASWLHRNYLQGLMPAGMIEDSYNAALFYQDPSDSVGAGHFIFAVVRGQDRGTEGQIGHVRYGLAHDADPNAPQAANPDMQGKSLLFGESQADYFQHAAKGYRSRQEALMAERQRTNDQAALKTAYGHYVSSMAEIMVDALDNEMQKIAPTVEEQREILSDLFTAEEMEKITDEQWQKRVDHYRFHTMVSRGSDWFEDRLQTALNQLREKYNASAQRLQRLQPQPQEVPYTGIFPGDARVFEMLDARALERMLSVITSRIPQAMRQTGVEYLNQPEDDRPPGTGVIDVLRDSLTIDSGVTPTPVLFKKYLGSIRKAGVDFNGSDGDYGARLPFMASESKFVLHQLAAQLGVERSNEDIDKAWESITDIRQVSFDINLDTFAREAQLDRNTLNAIFSDFITNQTNGLTPYVRINSSNPTGDQNTTRINIIGSLLNVNRAKRIFNETLIAFATPHIVDSQIHNLQQEMESLANKRVHWRRNLRGITIAQARKEHNLQRASVRVSVTNGEITATEVTNEEQANGVDVDKAQAIMANHDIVTFDEYVDDKWKSMWFALNDETRTEFEEAGYDENTPHPDYLTLYAREYNDSPPTVWVGEIPTEWDEKGNVTASVPIKIRKPRPNWDYDLSIDDDVFAEELEANKIERTYGYFINNYYESEGIEPPPNTLFGPNAEQFKEMDRQIRNLEKRRDNLREQHKGRIERAVATTVEPSKVTSYGDLEQAFLREIDFVKRKGVYPPQMAEQNDRWRFNHIQWLFSEMTRRGIKRAFFPSGAASGVRGGFVEREADAEYVFYNADSIQWTLEQRTVRGEKRDIVIVESPELETPMWIDVTGDKLLPFHPDRKVDESDKLSGYFSAELTAQLGRDVAEHIGLKIRAFSAAEKVKERYLVSATAGGDFMVHNTYGKLVGTAASAEEAERIRQRLSEDELTSKDVLIHGAVSAAEMGGPIQLLKLHYSGGPSYQLRSGAGYQHTVARPTMEGGRRNYDLTFPKRLREYIAQFGMTIEKGKMKVPTEELNYAIKAQGMRQSMKVPKDVAQQYPNVQIEEVTGENFGFIINSDGGPVLPNVFYSRQAAEAALSGWLNKVSIPEDGVVEVWQVTLNDKIEDHHRKSVSPFAAFALGKPPAWKKNKLLREAQSKVGSDQPSLVERFRQWRRTWRAETNVGAFDKFYGIQHALRETGQAELEAADNPYIQARMSTGLESRMRGIMEFGHPVWRDGVVENEGEGLLKILEPVANDIESWALYMAGVRAKRLKAEGREKLWSDEHIEAMVNLGEQFPEFKEVARKYAEFNKKMLDFAEESGVISAETRPMWEHADYIPFYRIVDERLTGPLASGVGVANQRSPIKTLKGGPQNVGDLMHNIMMNLTNLMDGSVKNRAALLAVDALSPSGIITKQPYDFSAELVPMGQVKAILKKNGIDVDMLEAPVLEGLQTMFALQPPKGEGVISVLRNGKKEFYHTDDALLYRSLTAINMKSWGQWMNLMRAPKRLLTTFVTLDPGFMIANYMRDSMSAFVLSRDKFVPMVAGLSGFQEALTEGDTMRAMIGSGAAFESGYINQGDPKSTQRLIKRAMRDAGFQRTLLNTPRKLYEAWKRVGSATENANRVAVYKAAIRAGKSKAQAAYEAKDLMDFSMGGDWPFIQFLIQTVPFMGARMQGLHRLGRGAAEHPVAFAMKGTLVGLAGLALWFAFRDDERYKDLEDWDKDTYFHWWIGDTHYRLPKGFEVGAIFNTVPERIFEYMYSNENDAGRQLMRRFGFMIAETFNANPIPQTFRPLVESWMNKNFFTGRSVEAPWETNKLPPDRYRYYTSPTMRELAASLPKELDLASQKIRSPLHLQNLYSGYTGTLGRYFLMASDAVIRQVRGYPEKPDMMVADYPVYGRFVRGSAPRRTRYEEEFYRMLRTTTQVQESLRAMDREARDARMDEIEREYAPYIEAAGELEGYRREVSALNAEIREINNDEKMSGAEKRRELNEIQEKKNALFKEAYELRPGAQESGMKTTKQAIERLLTNFNVDTPEANSELSEQAPITSDLTTQITKMPEHQLRRLEKASNYRPRE